MKDVSEIPQKVVQKQPKEGEPKEEKGLAKEILVLMYQESLNMARHHEEQRATATNIIITLSTAVIALVGTLFALPGKYDHRMFWELPAIIIVLSGSGLFLSLKHFEKSTLHFNAAECYRDLLQALVVNDKSENIIPSDKMQGIRYIKSAKEKDGKPRKGIERNPVKANEFKEIEVDTSQPSRIDPWPVFEPLHNITAVYFRCNLAKRNLFTGWAFIYVSILIIGVALFVLSFLI